jgi:hypothetical protein
MYVAASPKHFSANLNVFNGGQSGIPNGLPSVTPIAPQFHQTLKFQARAFLPERGWASARTPMLKTARRRTRGEEP